MAATQAYTQPTITAKENHMRQSIATKYFGPSNVKGSRIKAQASSGPSVTVGYDDALNSDENHMAAARKLADKLEWSGEWIGGATKDGYVFVTPDKQSSFTV